MHLGNVEGGDREVPPRRYKEEIVTLRNVLRSLAALAALCHVAPVAAYEFGTPGALQKPGITLGGATAAAPPPGLYMFDQVFTYQANFVGGSAPTGARFSGDGLATGLLIAPGWTFLGATYDAVIVQPFGSLAISSPINAQAAGVHNTFIVPAELSWKLGESGVFVKSGLGMYVPDGSISGPAGLSNWGLPWWTFEPELVVSYLKDGWNFTANMFAELNTANSITGYHSGDVLHAEFTAAKTFGNWTVGAVGYYIGQVSNDTSSAFYGNAINVNRYNVWAAGGMLAYNFGPATLYTWVTDEVSADAKGALPSTGIITKGWTAFAQLNYRLWAPEAPVTPPSPSIFRK